MIRWQKRRRRTCQDDTRGDFRQVGDWMSETNLMK
jgi:hypothetical protein